ncbi:hypothetical protein ACVXZZ_15865 [Staphylococcus aureus]
MALQRLKDAAKKLKKTYQVYHKLNLITIYLSW